MSKERKLPEGWKWMKIKEVAELYRGISYNKDQVSSIKQHNFLPILRANNINGELNFDDLVYVPSSLVKPEQYIQKGDIIFAMSSGSKHLVGKAAIAKDMIIGSYGAFCALLRSNSEDIQNSYLGYYFKGSKYRKLISKIAKGTNINNLKREHILDIDLPIPPIQTQQAIVSKIEELFSELDNGMAQLKKAQQQLKTYRQSILKWAFDGRLTNDNVEDGELPEGWKWMKLGDYINDIEAGKSFKCDERPPQKNEIGVLKVSAVTWGEFNENESKTVVDHNKINENYFVRKGDFLLSRANTIELVGNVVIANQVTKNVMLSDKTLRLIFSNEVNQYYILYFLRCRKGRVQIESLSTGNQASMRNIGQNRIKQIEFPFCQVEDQKRVVAEIERRLSLADKLQETIETALAQSESLRQSILKMAFEGRLVPEVVSSQMTKREVQEKTKIISVTPQKTRKKKTKPPTITFDFPAKIEGITENDLHAGVLALVIKKHKASARHKNKLSRVKGEKTAHCIEYKLGIWLGRIPQKDAAGPDDYNHLKKVEYRAQKANWFKTVDLDIGHTYEPLSGIDRAIEKIKTVLTQTQFNEVEQLIDQFLPFELEHAELVATLFAGWNNLLIRGLQPTDEEIVYESRENWSKRKLTIERSNFFKTLDWMKTHGYIPEGRGVLVEKSTKK